MPRLHEYHRRVADGVCVECSNRTVETVRCETCLAKRAEAKRERKMLRRHGHRTPHAARRTASLVEDMRVERIRQQGVARKERTARRRIQREGRLSAAGKRRPDLVPAAPVLGTKSSLVGRVVEHGKWGRGTVERVIDTPHGRRIVARWPRPYGQKTVLAEFVQLVEVES